jgi:Predicted phosphatases
MAELILFDLDGTLLDSKEGITKSVQYALKKLGVVVEDRRELVRFIGPPLQESFENFYGVDGRKGIQLYRECFVGEKKMLENEMYPGIPELLTQLKESGKKLVVATSKPTEYSKIILNHFGLASFFEEIQGSELDLSLVEKEDVIRVVLAKFPDYPKEKIIMIGDRRHDIHGAKVNGLKSIGVLYGYGSREELETAGADQIVETAEELYPLL